MNGPLRWGSTWGEVRARLFSKRALIKMIVISCVAAIGYAAAGLVGAVLAAVWFMLGIEFGWGEAYPRYYYANRRANTLALFVASVATDGDGCGVIHGSYPIGCTCRMVKAMGPMHWHPQRKLCRQCEAAELLGWPIAPLQERVYRYADPDDPRVRGGRYYSTETSATEAERHRQKRLEWANDLRGMCETIDIPVPGWLDEFIEQGAVLSEAQRYTLGLMQAERRNGP